MANISWNFRQGTAGCSRKASALSGVPRGCYGKLPYSVVYEICTYLLYVYNQSWKLITTIQQTVVIISNNAIIVTHLYLNQYQFKLKNQWSLWNPSHFTWKIVCVKNEIFHEKEMNCEEFAVQLFKWYVFLQLCDHFVSHMIVDHIC